MGAKEEREGEDRNPFGWSSCDGITEYIINGWSGERPDGKKRERGKGVAKWTSERERDEFSIALTRGQNCQETKTVVALKKSIVALATPFP